MARIIRLIPLLLVAALAGCGTLGLQTNVSSFHELGGANGQTIAVVPWRKELSGSLEFASYARQVEGHLRKAGYTIVDAGRGPDLIAFLDYGIDDGRNISRSYVIPQFGVTGYSSANTYGTVSTYGSTSTFSGTTSYTPQYGVTGYSSGVATDTVYTRFVNMDIVKVGSESVRVYEGRAKSMGSCGNIAVVAPQIIDVLMQNFPGKSGRAETIEVPFVGKC